MNPACAVCTIAVGASLSIARQIGVSDCVIGIWFGALFTIMGYWMIKYADKKSWTMGGKIKLRNYLLIIFSLLTIAPIYWTTITYTAIPYLLYLDSFLIAYLTGSLTFIITSKLYQWMKIKNNGRAHFPFEKVVLPVIALIIISVIYEYLPFCVN